VQQGAPARVTRGGLPLPVVETQSCDGCQPWVICTRFPNGATSVTTIGRTLPSGFVEAKANVTVQIGQPASASPVIGIFGYYEKLELVFAEEFETSNFLILAQDLTGAKPAEDITSEVLWDANAVTLPGTLIHKVGTAGRSLEEDVSSPGLVLQIFKASAKLTTPTLV